MSSPAPKVSTPQQILENHAPQRQCVGCPFGGPKVGSKGDFRAPLVFVGESPGLEEVKAREPLVGPSGRIFHEFVPSDGSVLILNALECRPLSGLKNEGRMNDATLCCQDHLLSKIRLHPRRLIVAMGNPAVRSLTGNYGLKITQIRGRLIPSPLAELGILPVVHVAALMRGTGSFRQWQQDIQYAIDLGAGGSPIEYIPAKVKIWPEGWMAFTAHTEQEAIDELFSKMGTELTGDIETSGLDHIQDRILSIGITPDNDLGISYCFYPHHLPYLKKHLESPHIKWCWHNGKFDIKFLRRSDVNAKVHDDTMLMSYAQDELGGVHDLETVSADVLGAPDYKYMIQPYLPNRQASYELVPPDVLAAYQAIDTSNTAQIRRVYRPRVKRVPELERLYTETLIPASELLANVEDNGILIDPQRLDENEQYFSDMKADAQRRICEMVGYNINPGSPPQVKELLFRRMRMPNKFKGSTSEEALVWLQKRTEHPIFALILEYRKATKMFGTYVKGYRKRMQPDTGRIHTTFLIHGSRTGRLASRQPNIQNIPRLAQIRGTFISGEGHILLEIDLSQAELRSLAALSQDPTLLEIYNEGLDLHSDLANYLYPGWDERAASDDPIVRAVAKEQRVKCKNVNFGIMYGITAFGLMGEIKDTRQAAQDMLDGWAEKYPVAWGFIQKCRRAPLNGQTITTCFGRKKRAGLVSHANKNFLMNEAANFPHQSIASDITLHAAMRCNPLLMKWGVRIVNLVHDSIIMEVPVYAGMGVRDNTIELVSREMAQVPRDYGITAVPFVSDAEAGLRWGYLTKLEETMDEQV